MGSVRAAAVGPLFQCRIHQSQFGGLLTDDMPIRVEFIEKSPDNSQGYTAQGFERARDQCQPGEGLVRFDVALSPMCGSEPVRIRTRRPGWRASASRTVGGRIGSSQFAVDALSDVVLRRHPGTMETVRLRITRCPCSAVAALFAEDAALLPARPRAPASREPLAAPPWKEGEPECR